MIQIFLSISLACADAYNETALDYACTLGCNSQTSSARKDLHHHQKKHETSPWSWTPNIYFTLRSSYSRPGISNDKESMDTSPLDMMKQLFSSLSQRVHSTSMWVTRKTSFTFLIGQGSDGKEKLLLLQPKQDTLQTQTSPAEPESVVNSYPDILPCEYIDYRNYDHNLTFKYSISLQFRGWKSSHLSR